MFARSSRGLLDFIAAALCVWSAAYHTPAGALLRDLTARLTGTRTTTRPLLAYYSGGVYDAREADVPTPVGPVPDDGALAAIPPGRALGRGAFAVLSHLEGAPRRTADEFAQHFHATLGTPEEVATALDHARAELGTDDAAVLALFAGVDVAAYAVQRARAEGRPGTFEALVRQLPPSASGTLQSASSTLTLGTAYSLSWPVAPGTRVSSPFGWREHPILGRGQMHTGVDLSIPEGTPVKVVADGTVTRASEDAVNGRVVIVDHGRGVLTAYCHNSQLLVTTGERVHAGQVISESGTTGRSTGPHLHYQLELGRKPMDPFLFRGSKPLLELPTAPPVPGRSPPGAPPPDPHATLKKAFDLFPRPPDTEE
jgi:murein DD-endopeptidase MepM/ murein hydrolase activator NlpD